MKYFYLYKTTNLINNKFYIGVHASHKEHDLNYFGSGVAINRAIEKYGIENFKNEIISYHESLKAAYDAERILVNEELIKQKVKNLLFLLNFDDTCRKIGYFHL